MSEGIFARTLRCDMFVTAVVDNKVDCKHARWEQEFSGSFTVHFAVKTQGF
jgi:hypothetical protein